VDRLSFSVIWDMAPDGTILRQWAGRSAICTAAKLAYQHAEAMIVEGAEAWAPPEGVALKAPHTWQQVGVTLAHLSV
jgi:DIS3-like exonuclease 2